MHRLRGCLLPAAACAALVAGPSPARATGLFDVLPPRLAVTAATACIGNVGLLPDCFLGLPLGQDPATASASDSGQSTTIANSSASTARDGDSAASAARAEYGVSVGAESSATAVTGGADRTAQAGALASWFGVYEIGAPGTDVDLGFAITNGAATDGLFLGDGVTGATDLAITIGAISEADLGDLSTQAQLDALNAFLGGNLYAGTARLDNPPAMAGDPALSTTGDLGSAGLTQSTVCAGGTGTCVDFGLALDFNDVLVGTLGDRLLLNVNIAASSQVDVSGGGAGGTASTDLLDTLTVSVTSDNGVVTLQSVPEPATALLAAIGLAGLGARRRRRRGSR